MKLVHKLALDLRWVVVVTSILVTLAIFLLTALPSFFPEKFPNLYAVQVDTDPENMLSEENPVRIFDNEAKEAFSIYDTIIVGVINDEHPQGVFNKATLSDVYNLIEYAKGIEGVITQEIFAPSTIDNIEQAGIGAVSFNWMMPEPPESDAAAAEIRDDMLDLPMMRGFLIDEAGKSLMLAIPIESKDMSYRISTALLEEIETFGDDTGDEYHITGLPVANDTFGVQMFIQMAISAPIAMTLIFILLLIFFKRLRVILSAMIVALMSVIMTMGALVVSGQTVHIMSSMIPIFIMPIAVLDAVHILSEFYDRYPKYKDKRETAKAVIEELWRPMLFTTLTTTVGFGSLALAPIPPVQVFGIFVALGVLLAWLLTVTFIPAYLTFLPEKSLENFGLARHDEKAHGFLAVVARFTGHYPKLILGVTLVLCGVAAYGISQIEINDNPIKWFEASHRIRVADRILNERFLGTYPAYLHFEAEDADSFKNPELLNYLNDLQAHVKTHPNVGKTMSVTDIIQTVFREMMEGEEEFYRIPDTSRAVAQTLLTYESSHRPGDLFHFVTPDYSEGVIWFQLNNGDNREMSDVVEMTGNYLRENPPPVELEHNWFGLTYINVVWQDEMVAGMLSALLSSFVIVLIMMKVLFRSIWWGILSMVPLTITIALIYGILGIVGKDYDMPVAVLSSLSLGLAIDYAIHFIARSQGLRRKYNSWQETLPAVFGEPARAIARNIIVIGIGFTPLLLAPLVPYQTVGMLISSILLIAGFASLLILPALIKTFERRLFRKLET